MTNLPVTNLPAPNLSITPAVAGDVPVILDLIRRLAEYEKLSHICVATEEALARTLFGPHPHAEVLLARIGGECAGFALFFTNYSTFLAKPGLYLEDLFVKPEFRGQGIGRALLEQLAAIACERDYGRMEWTVLDWNDLAVGFYKRIGAVPLDDWTVFRITGDALRRLGGA